MAIDLNIFSRRRGQKFLVTCSMCESPYSLEWQQDELHCPNLLQSQPRHGDVEETVPVSIRWNHNVTRTWPSLAHVWSSYYQEYSQDDDTDAPRIFVRFEDLLFHTQTVVNKIRECVGATWIHDAFQYIPEPAKAHPYFARFKPPTSLVSAMIKYGQDDDSLSRRGTMTLDNFHYASRILDPELMKLFHYDASLKLSQKP